MKRLMVCFLMVVMILAVFSVFVGAADTTAYGLLAFEENFDDPSKADTYLSSALGGNKPDGVTPVREGEKVSSFKIEDGKLKVSTWSIATKAAMRFKLYDIPENATGFTVIMDVKSIESHSARVAGNSVGLIIADNNFDNWDSASMGTIVDSTPGAFQFCWHRIGTTGGVTRYGDLVTELDVYTWPKDDYVANINYTTKISVDLTTDIGTYVLTNKDTGTQVCYENFIYAYSIDPHRRPEGLNSQIGLFFNGVTAEVDSVKVYVTGVDASELGIIVEETTVETTNTSKENDKLNLPIVLVMIVAIVMLVVVAVVIVHKRKRASNTK